MSRKLSSNSENNHLLITLLFIIISGCTVILFQPAKTPFPAEALLKKSFLPALTEKPAETVIKWKTYSNQFFSFNYPDTWVLGPASTADKLVFEACSAPVFTLSRQKADSLDHYMNSLPPWQDTRGHYFFAGHLAYINYTYDYPDHPEKQLPPEKITAYIPVINNILELTFTANCREDFNRTMDTQYKPLIASFKIADQVPGPSWKTYTNAQYHFSFKYPSGLILDTQTLGFWNWNKPDFHLLIRDPGQQPSLSLMSSIKDYDGYYFSVFHGPMAKEYADAIEPKASNNDLYSQTVKIDTIPDVPVISAVYQLSTPDLLVASFARFDHNGNTFTFSTGYPVETLKAILSTFRYSDN